MLCVGLAFTLVHCAPDPPRLDRWRRPTSERAYRFDLPPGLPEPIVPPDNPMSSAKVELGRHLFYDARLSGSGTLACAGCHQQARAFTDGRPRARGSTGELHPRSSMSLVNVAYNVAFGWADPTIQSLEAQALVPLLNEMPVEMGIAGRESEIEARLDAEPRYRAMFRDAFPDDPGPIRIENVARAIAAFERTIVSAESAYDRLLFRDDRTALSAAARRGMDLFFSDRIGCSGCHAGVLLGGPTSRAELAPPLPTFHNTGLYDLDGAGSYPASDVGLSRVTGRAADMGRFRAPSLRNVALTAPYMHDGSIDTLESVIDHYAAGGRAADSPLKSERLRGFAISADERSDLVAFLRDLTDVDVTTRLDLSDPFVE